MYNTLKHSNWWRYVVTLIIGGLLVALGYLIGDSATNVEAQDNITKFDIITCKGIIVSDGNPENGFIMLGISKESADLILSDHADLSKAKSQIQINVGADTKHGTEAAVLKLINAYNDGSSINLVAGRGESAAINMGTKKRINDALSLWTGSKGSGIMLEGDLVQSRMR